MIFCGPGGIRTRGLFSAIEEQVGEKGKKVVFYVYCVPKSPYCISISVPKLFPQYEARKGDPYMPKRTLLKKHFSNQVSRPFYPNSLVRDKAST